MKRIDAVAKFTLALLLAIALFAGGSAFAAIKATVYSSSMKVYSRTDTSSKYLIGALKNGVEFNVTAASGDWAKIEYKGYTGFARISDIKTKQKVTMYVNSASSVYQEASSSSRVLCKLNKNVKVYVVGMSGSYFLIDNGSGGTGYISKKSLSANRATVTVYTNRITTVYSSASTARPLFDVNVNTKLSASGISGNYTIITYGGDTYYLKTAHLSTSKSAEKRITAYTNSKCDVYKRASSSSGKLATLGVNAKVYAVGVSGSYFAVTSTDGKAFGYIAKNKLSNKITTANDSENAVDRQSAIASMPAYLKSSTSKATQSMSAAQKIEVVIYLAQSKLGCAYSSNPNNSTTFDCLTLCSKAFRTVSANIPSTAYACGYTGNYKYITSISALKRGDIVCFDTIDTDNDKSDHVGIYLGDGYFIHASSGAGVVIVSKLNSGFYKDCFFAGRRVLE